LPLYLPAGLLGRLLLQGFGRDAQGVRKLPDARWADGQAALAAGDGGTADAGLFGEVILAEGETPAMVSQTGH
jgi:hypothetical protein